jgi:proton-translocating NADH-quinone oxidoreductase chain N
MAVATKESQTLAVSAAKPSDLPVVLAALFVLVCAAVGVVLLPVVAAEITVAGTAAAIVVADWFLGREQQARLGLLGIFGLMVASGLLIGVQATGYAGPAPFGGALQATGVATLYRLLVLSSGALAMGLSLDYVGRRISAHGEYYALMTLSIFGGMLLSAAGELVTFFLALEMTSIPLYILVSLRKTEATSSEAGLKYLVTGAVSSALLLYGFSWVYGMTGTTSFAEIAGVISATGATPPLVFALVLSLAGILYKLGAVPFHMWAPDVYEGAPVPVTAFVAVTSKIAGVIAMARLVGIPFSSGQLETRWVLLVAFLAAVSMTVGNLVALAQRNIKRLMAYSSIAHAGYLMTGIVALYRPDTLNAGLVSVSFYAIVYGLATLAAFAVITHVARETGSTELDAYAGLAKRAPGTAAVMLLALISLAGLPPLAGFTAKFYLFGAAVQSGFTWLAIVGVINSVVSLYYYVAIIRTMYFAEPADPKPFEPPAAGVAVVLGLSAVVLVGLFVLPAPLLTQITALASNL